MADYYADNPGPDAMTQTAKESTSSHADDTPVGEDEPTGLLPKSILAGKHFEPGDEIVLRITRIMDDQVEVAYAPEKKSDEGEGEEGGEGMGMAEKAGDMAGDSAMRSYME